MKVSIYFKRFVLALLANILFLLPVGAATTYAAVTNPVAQAKVSFTFDDGLVSSLTQAAPTLAKYGIKGTNYVSTNCIGMTTAPNNCQADKDAIYMSWDQVAQLKNQYGWEIGSHTADHRYMATSEPEEQPNVLTPAEITEQLVNSKNALAARGINATSYASPYGDYNAYTLSQIAKYYETQRGFADIGYNNWPNSEYLLRVQQVQGNISVNTVKNYINSAIANKQWLILVFHDIKVQASTQNDDYQYSTSKLNQIASYVKSKGVATPTVSQAIVKGDVNLISNSSFNSGLNGWTTDNPNVFTLDSGFNGSYPDATNSVKVTASNTTSHLFSPSVPVTFGSSYVLKNYSNITKLNSGDVGYYIDEYDANGNWISGQYKATQRAAWVDQVNFGYSPTSSSVRSARLQISISGNSGITGYIDNSQWYSITSAPAPNPVTNLITNGNFESGFTGWSTDSTNSIKLDSANNGSPANPVNSVYLSSTSKNAHLFSSQITVDSTKTYTLNNYLNIKQQTGGEIGYYIDEYDANGNWISGQFKRSVSGIGANTISFSYKPSSSNVKKASLQIIVSANSGIVAFVDNIELLN